LERSVLEELALHAVQHGARGGRVVGVGGGQLPHLAGERTQLLDRLRPGAQRAATGLVGERHRHLDARDPRERLHGVALQRCEVIEAVDEHRIRGGTRPALRIGAQRVKRAPGEQLAIDPAQRVELTCIGGVDPPKVVRESSAPDVLGGPRTQRLGEALRGDERALQLGDEVARGEREPRPARRGVQGVETVAP
jgi:hypothetical protein